MASPIVIPLNTGGTITQQLPASFDATGDTVRLYLLPNRYAAETTYISGTVGGSAGAWTVTFVVPASQTTVAGVKWARARIYPASGDPLQLFSRKLIVTTNEVTSSTAVAAAPSGGGVGGAVSSVFGRAGDVTGLVGDYSGFYQPLDSDLTAIAALTTVAFGRGLLTAADAAALRTLAALGTAATANKVAAGTAGVLDATDASTTNARTPTAHAASHASGGSDPTSLAASQVTSGVFNIARLATGTPDGTKFVRDDGTLATPAGGAGGDVVKIATVTVGAGGAATIDFSSIPSTYRNLRLQLTGRLATGAGGFAVCSLTYNGSTAAAYDVNFVKNASGTITGGNSAGNVGHDFNMTDPGATALLPATLDLILFDYARTAWYKLSRAENGLFYNAFSSSLNVTSWQVWRNTAAVNRITLTPPANFAQDTVATLYGMTG